MDCYDNLVEVSIEIKMILFGIEFLLYTGSIDFIYRKGFDFIDDVDLDSSHDGIETRVTFESYLCCGRPEKGHLGVVSLLC